MIWKTHPFGVGVDSFAVCISSSPVFYTAAIYITLAEAYVATPSSWSLA